MNIIKRLLQSPVILIALVLVIALGATLVALGSFRDTRARVIIDNQSQCGTIPVRLTNPNDNSVLKDSVPIGERHEILVTPDVRYTYEIDFTATGPNHHCTALEQGSVKVPAGTSQTFTLSAETPIPTIDTRARVIIDNQSQCGTIPVRLTNPNDNSVLKDSVPIGERREIVVTPDVRYTYEIDFTATGPNHHCTALEQGSVKVPAGTSQTFTLRAETPIPTITPKQ